jgi:methyl-accepting chemotaxis protein
MMRQITQVINHHSFTLLSLPILHGLLVWACILDVINLGVFWAAMHVTFLMMLQIVLDIRKGVKALKDTELLELGFDQFEYPLCFADKSHTIVYKNKALRTFENDEKLARYRDVISLLTQGLFRFSKLSFVENQVKSKKLLKSLSSAYETQITLNTKVYRIALTPVFGEQADRLGTLIEWKIQEPLSVLEADIKSLKGFFETIKFKQTKDSIVLVSKKPELIHTLDLSWIVDRVEQFNDSFAKFISNMHQKGTLNRRIADESKIHRPLNTGMLKSAVKPNQQLQSALKQFKTVQGKLSLGLNQIGEVEKQQYSNKQQASLAKLRETVYQVTIGLNQSVNQLEHLMKSLQRARRVTDRFDTIILNAKSESESESESDNTPDKYGT